MSLRSFRAAARVFFSALVFVVMACGEQSPTRPLSESGALTAQGPASQAALEAQINGLITALYPPQEQGDVVRDFARIKAQVASGRTADAQTSIVTFVQTLLGDLAAGDLEDPNGAQPPSTADALASLVNSVAQFGGLPAPIPPSNPLGGDGAVAVVGPAGGTVVASSGFGGVQFPPGALPANVIVVVSRLPNPTTPATGPLPTTFAQYPLFYDFSTTPPVAQFAQPVLVGICQLEVGQPFGPPTQTVANRLQLAHPNPANPTTVELLAREAAPFVDCSGVTLAQARQQRQGEGILASALGRIRDLGTRALATFRPTPLYAVHGGLGGKTTSFSPFGAVDPGGITPIVGQLAAGANHACAIAASGQTWCWGTRQNNPLGDGAPSSLAVSAPVPVAGNPAFTQITSSGLHSCGLLASGTAMCWGRNVFGELGRGPFGPSTVPVQVLGGPFREISANRLTTCAVDLSNDAWCWGANQRGELGNPAFSSSNVPVLVATTLKFQNISAGWLHTCGIQTGGPAAAAHCWGEGDFVGAGPVPDQPTPIAVTGGLTFTQLSAGVTHTCGLTQTGAAYCWGRNTRGELGDGSTIDRLVPTPVSGGLSFVVITSGVRILQPITAAHTCGLTTTGATYCWGSNDLGQLGDGTTADRLVPTPVSTSQVFVAISAGGEFTCGMTAARKVFCWGSNGQGELGSGIAGGISTTPVAVPAPFN